MSEGEEGGGGTFFGETSDKKSSAGYSPCGAFMARLASADFVGSELF
jgi:hypothetical protein